MTVVGIPTVRFELASLTGEAQLFAKLYDVAPDGSTQLVRRLVAPIRATDLDGTLSAQLVGMAHRFEEGHAIRLVFAATDAAYANERIPTQYAMNIEPGEASLSLPLVGTENPATAGNAVGRTKTATVTNRERVGATRGGGAGETAQLANAATLPATGGGASALVGVALLAGAVGVRRLGRVRRS
jgi:predicted acyl esterase